MRVKLNGQLKEIKTELRLPVLLEELGLNQMRVAVELNRVIVPPADFFQTIIKEGDELEIVHFVGGG